MIIAGIHILQRAYSAEGKGTTRVKDATVATARAETLDRPYYPSFSLRLFPCTAHLRATDAPAHDSRGSETVGLSALEMLVENVETMETRPQQYSDAGRDAVDLERQLHTQIQRT